MTIKELYELAVENGCENIPAFVGYRDGFGDFYCATEAVDGFVLSTYEVEFGRRAVEMGVCPKGTILLL